MFAVEVKDLVKDYGHFHAVKSISFNVKEGEVFGLIGPNGAGKTTTLRLLSTLLEITGGEVKIFGLDLKKQPSEVRKVISYLPEDAGAYKNMTGMDYLKFMAGFFAPEKDPEALVAKGLEIVHLNERINDKIETYSKGMARRLLVGRALMMDPKLAILDEITSGLDVVNAQSIRKVVRQKTQEGTTVLLSSHNMLEVELMCDRIALINDGRIVETGTPHELMERYKARNIEEVFVEVVK
jgi:ABC-2 type transport system ATP-binding protein